MNAQHPLQTKQELVDLMKRRGWSLSGIVAATESSTFGFANVHPGEDEINTLSFVGYGENATQDERFFDTVRRYLDEESISNGTAVEQSAEQC